MSADGTGDFTPVAAIWPSFQGILLTAKALGLFVAAMMLIPRIRAAAIASPSVAPSLPAVPG
jgi:hypothetical protein